MITVLRFFALFLVMQLVQCYGFYCHDLIAEMVWNSTDDYLKGWLCSQYDCCTAMDMRTLAALPDLLKHTEKFIKYFHLHFFNNESDFPPQHCSIDYQVAISAESPNLIQAVQVLLQKQYSTRKLSFIELSYLIHLISDLHQPLHVTGFQRGGLERMLCSGRSETCFSLHAMWDAELHKRVNFHAPTKVLPSPLNIEATLFYVNKNICELYVFDLSDDLEAYAAKFEPLAKRLLQEAAQKVLWLLEETLEMDSLNTAQDFERELAQLLKSANASSSSVSSEIYARLGNLVRQFKTKSAFLSGYRLRSLKEKIGNLSTILSQKAKTDDINIIQSFSSPDPIVGTLAAEFEDKRMRIADMSGVHDFTIECSGDLIIENVNDSTIFINGTVSSAVIKSVHGAYIMLSSSGSVNVKDCSITELSISAHQLRIHDSNDCVFKICCEAGSIVEDCTGLSFCPISSGQDEYKWKNVEDFTSFDQSSFTFKN